MSQWFIQNSPLLATVAAAISAIAALLISYAGRKTSRGQLVSDLHNQHWSNRYYRANTIILLWVNKFGSPEYVNVFQKWYKLERSQAVDKLNKTEEKEYRDYQEVNKARRIIKGYFRKTQQLSDAGFLKKKDVKNILCPKHRVSDELFAYIIQFEYAINGLSPSATLFYQYYAKLHNLKLPKRIKITDRS